MNAYFDQIILSASPVELVRLLFQRAIVKVREARIHLKEGRIEDRAFAINAAYSVMAELMNSMDSEAAPELAQRLKSLYCYVQERLLEANLKQTDAPLAGVLGVLTTLLEAWSEVPDQTADAAKPNPWANSGSLSEDSACLVLTA